MPLSKTQKLQIPDKVLQTWPCLSARSPCCEIKQNQCMITLLNQSIKGYVCSSRAPQVSHSNSSINATINLLIIHVIACQLYCTMFNVLIITHTLIYYSISILLYNV